MLSKAGNLALHSVECPRNMPNPELKTNTTTRFSGNLLAKKNPTKLSWAIHDANLLCQLSHAIECQSGVTFFKPCCLDGYARAPPFQTLHAQE